MKRLTLKIFTWLLVVGSLIAVGENSENQVFASDYEYSEYQLKALERVNTIRRSLGFEDVKLNPYLSKASENHAYYRKVSGANGNSPHEETEGYVGFTGVTLRDRAIFAGFQNDSLSLSEVMTYTSEPIAAVNGLVDVPLHRAPIIDPRTTEIGIGSYENVFVMVTGTKWETIDEEFVYPIDGATNVNIHFCCEWPNPLEMYNTDHSGYAITYVPKFQTSVTDVKVTNKQGEDMPIFYYLQDEFHHFFPRFYLFYDSTYTVTVKTVHNITGEESEKTWSFTTRKDPSKREYTYADMNKNEYWANHMLWAIEEGLITGYLNQENPQTGRFENWLKPYNPLTEAQFITILFRYLKPYELAGNESIFNNNGYNKHWAFAVYDLAWKYNLPTNAKSMVFAEYNKYADKGITRGKMAQILASAHFNRTLSEREAVDFMYEAHLSNGYPDASGNLPKTYESFSPNQILKRAQVVTFLKRYDEYRNK